jgi:hypothetical protein
VVALADRQASVVSRVVSDLAEPDVRLLLWLSYSGNTMGDFSALDSLGLDGRPWKVLLLVLLCIMAIYAGTQWWRHAEMNARLEAAIAATDAIDPNWRWADMVNEYEKLPTSPNFPQLLLPWRGYRGWFGDDIGERPGALHYDRTGFHYTVRFPLPYFKILKERLEIADETGPTVMREALKLMALEPRYCKVPFDDLKLLDYTNYASNYLLDEMELAAHLGKEDALVSQLESQLRLCRYLKATPRYHNFLYAMSWGRKGESGIKRGLALGTLSPSVLLQCQRLFEAETPSDFVHILRSLRAEQFDELEQAKTDTEKRQKLRNRLMNSFVLPKSPTLEQRAMYWWKWLQVESALNDLSLAQAEILEFANESIVLAKNNPKALTLIDPAQLPKYASPQSKKIKNMIAQDFAAALFKLTSAEMSSQAERHALILALACERYRLDKGRYPETLDDLIPDYLKAVPTDLYTGKEYLYRKLSDGIVCYSVGLNRIDDGGDVLYLNRVPNDRGVKLFNPELRGKKYEELPTETKQP